MSPFGLAMAMAVALLASAALVGLWVRRRVRSSWLFPIYLGVAGAGSALVLARPATFWTWDFFAATDLLQAALTAGIAFEIAYRTFRPLPVGFRRVRMAMLAVLLGLAVALVFQARPLVSAFDLAQVLERVSYGTSFLFLAFMLLTGYYGVPTDPLYRDVAAGFVFVNLVVGCASALAAFDPLFDLGRYFVSKTAYPCALAWWVVAAWRREDYGWLSPETVRYLQPWRVR
jgi:hypothetical protein